jgi:glutamine amidotransferase
MLVIIDYGLGNLGSIQNMLRKIGTNSVISSDPEVIEKANKLILPGVGSFDYGISQLRSRKYYSILENKVLFEKRPILGICLGMQLFMEKSEEGILPGLGWIKGEVLKFNIDDPKLKIPHMGWQEVTLCQKSKLFTGMFNNPRFYFVHSYYVKPENKSDDFLISEYGYPFTAGIENGNICGVQFHPEKSHKYGMKLLKNFVELY